MVTGHVTDCPAYLSVTVNDRTAGEELCLYDTLVSCPPRFNITINLPPVPPRHSTSTTDDRVLEVVLHDSKLQQRVFLSSFVARYDRYDVSPTQSRPVSDAHHHSGNYSNTVVSGVPMTTAS